MIAIDPPCLGGSSPIQEIKRSLKEVRRKKYALLSDFSYDLFMMKTSEIISKIFTTSQITNSQQCVKIARKIFIYMKLRSEYFVEFFSTLENLFPTDETAIIACVYTLSKLMKLVPRKFLKKLFSSYVTNQQNFPINLAYFAYIMIKESFDTAIFCINELIDLLSQIIISSDQNARFIAFDTLNIALKSIKNSSNLNQEHIINNLFFHATEKLKSDLFYEQHGSFLILGSIFQDLPHQILNQSIDLLNYLITTLNSPQLHSFSLYNIIVLSRYDKEFFLKNHYTTIYDILINDNLTQNVTFLQSHCFLLFYLTFSEQVISNEAKMIEILDNLINYKETINQAYRIIHHISINFSEFLTKNDQFFMSLFLKSIPFMKEITHEFVDLIQLVPNLFDENLFGQAVLTEIERNQTSNLLEFFSLCPSFKNSEIDEILLTMLSSSDQEIRKLAPSALLNQLSYDDRTFVVKVFERLFTIALSDRNPSIRLSVVCSFCEKSYKYLTLPSHLESLMKLAHDESIDVKNETILLLGKLVVFDPLNVLVILRAILLEHMFSIDMKSLKSVKSQTVKSLLPLFEASKEILSLFSPTFCDIALRELSNTPSEKMTYFDRKFFKDISKNIIEAVCFIAKTDISLIKSHLKQFVNFFLWQLQQKEITKEIKLSIIETLHIILTKADSIEDIDMNKVSASLLECAACWNSKKLNLAVFKLVGFIGCSELKNENENLDDLDSMNQNKSPNDPSYFLSCSCQVLLDILNDSKLFSYHMSCLKSLSIIFSNDFQMCGQNYFSKFIVIVIDQVRLTNSPEYIEILNSICNGSPHIWVIKYKSEIINLTQEMIEKKDHPENILDFIPTLCKVFKNHVETFYQNGISLLYDILEKNMKNEERNEVSLKCLNSIISMRSVTSNFCFINVPKLLHFLTKKSVVKTVKYKIIDSFSFLFQQNELEMASFVPMILRSLSDFLVSIDSKNDRVFIEKVMQSIYSIMVKYGSDFVLFESQMTFLIDSLKNISQSQKDNYRAILNKSKPCSIDDFGFIQKQTLADFLNNKPSQNLNETENNKGTSQSSKETAISNNINSNTPIQSNEISKINDKIDNIGMNNDNKTNNKNDNDNKNDSSDIECQNNKNDKDSSNDDNDNKSSEVDGESMVNSFINEKEIREIFSIPENSSDSIDESWNWKTWHNRVVCTFIRLSPSPFISSCSFLCENLFSKAETIFYPAFLSVYLFLTEDTQIFISENVTRLLSSDFLPKRTCSSIISLIEFLERNECNVTISKEVLVKVCEKCKLYSNSFLFAYKWAIEEPYNIEANKALIRISTFYGQIKMKKGISKIVQKRIDTSNSPEWFELIGEWSKARSIYEGQNNEENFVKILKCFQKEQCWDEIINKIDLFESIQKVEFKQSLSKSILLALYNRQKWDKIEQILPFCPQNSIKVLSILALFQNFKGRKNEAKETIEKAFTVLASNSAGMIKNDQTLLEKLTIKSQKLNEIFEIIIDDQKSNKIWEKRIEKLPKKYEYYNEILMLRLTNKITIAMNQKHILMMLKLALKEEEYKKFHSSLNYFYPIQSKWPISVAFLNCKSIWKKGNKKEAIDKISSLLKDQHFVPQIEADQQLKCQMYYTNAAWIFGNSSLHSIFLNLKQAVDLLEISMRTKIRFYKSFHYWAWSCSLMFMKASNVKQHAVSAIHGFLECIKLKEKTPFDDIIQMTSLFFRVKLDDKSFEEISKRIQMLNDQQFLLIIPQLFAQISSNQKSSQSLFVAKILMRLLPDHYHIIWPDLLFDREQNQIVDNLVKFFSKSNTKAFNEGMTIKNGLVLCSTSTLETWQVEITKTIAEIQKKNWRLAYDTLTVATSKPFQPGEGEKEEEFRNKIQSIINSNLAALKKSFHVTSPSAQPSPSSQNATVKKSRSTTDLKNQNATIISNSKDKNSMMIETIQMLRKTHNEIKDHLYNIQYLSMFNVAPDLFFLRNSIVAVPGTYKPLQPKILIKQFDPTLEIYNSKQRPRFLVIYGDDGSRHKSLLKGREDLRLDSRLMQFFKLINQYCQKVKTAKISRYSITPITKKCGLIQFVEEADTIFSLVTEYRRSHNMNIFEEQTIETAFSAQNVDSMRPIQRLEALREAAKLTNDDDLRKSFILKSPTSKILMQRTITFSESCAVMSIVGYILGIGDRHPSNILIHRSTGKVIHIDFGDSFDAAKKRKFFPEVVPFRLTRMMVKSFGPSEIEGGFRITCEETLKLMRKHIYPLMAVLDIFMTEPIEDPLNSDPQKSVIMSKKNKKNLEEEDNEDENDVEDDEVVSPDIKESIRKVGEKIMGKDLDLIIDDNIDNDNNDNGGFKDLNNNHYSIEDHVSFLIRNATDEYNLAYLYHGWTPLW